MKILFVRPLLEALNEGRMIRKAAALALRIVAVLFALLGVYLTIEILKAAFQKPTEGTLGGLVFAILFAGSVAVVAQILFYRAEQVAALGDSPFTVIPIVAILLRAAGEVYAALGTAIGVGGCLFIWFAKENPLELIGGMAGLLPGFSGEMSFLGGAIFLVYLLGVSFGLLVLFYFLAESTVVLVDIAQNIRALGGASEAKS